MKKIVEITLKVKTEVELLTPSHVDDRAFIEAALLDFEDTSWLANILEVESVAVADAKVLEDESLADEIRLQAEHTSKII